jgi:galactitol-1-phosphate 5-dehydrogenase
MPSPACRCCPASSARSASEYFSLCKQYQFVGSRSEGGNAEYVVVKRANLFRLPDQMPIDDGAFIEPITVGLHAFHLAQGCEGKNVIIIGAGTIGLLALQCARELGANSVTAIDINPQKLELAKTLGATRVFNSREMSGQAIQQALEAIQFDQLVLEIAVRRRPSPERLTPPGRGRSWRWSARPSRFNPPGRHLRADLRKG